MKFFNAKTDGEKAYNRGWESRNAGHPKAPPGGMRGCDRSWWLAGWNDRDRELAPSGVELWDADPNCVHDEYDAPGGGLKCRKCSGWFCF